jgi:multiple antibiotic resistance protein
MDTFWLCFVPLFVAVDAVGVLPMFLSLTEGVDSARSRTVVYHSVITATAVALAFLAFGPALLKFLGITVPDFMIAGGLLLIVFSLSDLLRGEKEQRRPDADSLGVVPIGVPLITGPAVLATCVLLAGLYGRLITAAALVANIVIAGIVFLLAQPITRTLGRTGTKIVSKIASLLLTAIAVMLIRKGITEIVAMSASL